MRNKACPNFAKSVAIPFPIPLAAPAMEDDNQYVSCVTCAVADTGDNHDTPTYSFPVREELLIGEGRGRHFEAFVEVSTLTE